LKIKIIQKLQKILILDRTSIIILIKKDNCDSDFVIESDIFQEVERMIRRTKVSFFRRLKVLQCFPYFSGDQKLKKHYFSILISLSYLWLTNFSGDQKP
jgi:hypothetical protein